MADNYKILAQSTANSAATLTGESQANIVYTVPSNTQAAISSISLINSSTTSEQYSIGVVTSQEVPLSSLPGTSFIEYSPLFLSMGNENIGAYSADAINWTQFATPGSASIEWKEVAYGNNKFVAISFYTRDVITSTDGITWTLGTLPNNSGGPTSIAYGNGKFVILEYSGSTLSSEDGINWTISYSIGNNPYGSWYAIAYGNGGFVVVGYAYVGAFSSDGISWTQSNIPIFGSWETLGYGNGKFIAAAGGSQFVYSEDNGQSWNTTQTIPNRAGFPYGIAYGNDKFVVGTSGARSYSSTDGINWTSTTIPMNFNYVSNVAYGNGKFVATGFSEAAVSEDGVSWIIVDLPRSPSQSLINYNSLGFGNSASEQEVSLNAILPKQTIIPNRSIEPNTVDEITGGITLSAGDQIRLYSESPDLIVQVYGVEIA